MRLVSLDIESYTEHDPDRVPTGTPFEGVISLRVLPGDCTLALFAQFAREPDEAGASMTLPRLFVTHSEEGGAVAYTVTPLIPRASEPGAGEAERLVRYELPFRPARAGQHALLLEVAYGGEIESHEWGLRVRHAYDA